jgi:hypothetical protein
VAESLSARPLIANDLPRFLVIHDLEPIIIAQMTNKRFKVGSARSPPASPSRRWHGRKEDGPEASYTSPLVTMSLAHRSRSARSWKRLTADCNSPWRAGKVRRARSLAIKLDRPPRIVHFIFGLMAHSIPFIVADMPEADAFQLHSAFSARQLPLSAL